MIKELNEAVGEVVANGAPEHLRKDPAGRAIRVPANALREQSVHAHGRMQQMEKLLAVYFGGVP